MWRGPESASMGAVGLVFLSVDRSLFECNNIAYYILFVLSSNFILWRFQCCSHVYLQIDLFFD